MQREKKELRVKQLNQKILAEKLRQEQNICQQYARKIKYANCNCLKRKKKKKPQELKTDKEQIN